MGHAIGERRAVAWRQCVAVLAVAAGLLSSDIAVGQLLGPVVRALGKAASRDVAREADEAAARQLVRSGTAQSSEAAEHLMRAAATADLMAVLAMTTAADAAASSGERAVMKALIEMVPDLTPFKVVPHSVKRFQTEFREGALQPAKYLSKVDQDGLLARWEQVPREKRVFIIGAGEDTSEIATIQHGLRDRGFEVFFYAFCRTSGGKLCPSQTVGAAFATSGQAILYETRAALASKFVPIEISTAQQLANPNSARNMLVFNPSEALALTAGSGTFPVFIACTFVKKADMATAPPTSLPMQGVPERPAVRQLQQQIAGH